MTAHQIKRLENVCEILNPVNSSETLMNFQDLPIGIGDCVLKLIWSIPPRKQILNRRYGLLRINASVSSFYTHLIARGRIAP